MTSSRRQVLLGALVVAVLSTPAGAAADPGPYARVDLGFGTGRLHEVGFRDFGIGFSWSGAAGWHVSRGLALHGTAWGTSQVSDGWQSFVYDDHIGRLDVVALGPGATVRHEPTRFFVGVSAGGAFLRVRRGTPRDHDVHRDWGLAATLRAGFGWPLDDAGPAFGFSLGGSYVRPLSNAGEWYPHGAQLDLALTVVTR